MIRIYIFAVENQKRNYMKSERKNPEFEELTEEEMKQVTGGEGPSNDICKVNVKEFQECRARGGVWINCVCTGI